MVNELGSKNCTCDDWSLCPLRFGCRKCRDWDSCYRPVPWDKDWFSYTEIRYCRYQVMWILLHRATLESGNWPPEYKETGYTGGDRKSSNAPYTSAIIITSDVSKRWVRTGKDGIILEDEVWERRPFEFLRPQAKDALAYISGWPEKKQDYTQWLADKERKKRNRKAIKTMACGRGIDKN